jgi:hypothetical protein
MSIIDVSKDLTARAAPNVVQDYVDALDTVATERKPVVQLAVGGRLIREGDEASEPFVAKVWIMHPVFAQGIEEALAEIQVHKKRMAIEAAKKREKRARERAVKASALATLASLPEVN